MPPLGQAKRHHKFATIKDAAMRATTTAVRTAQYQSENLKDMITALRYSSLVRIGIMTPRIAVDKIYARAKQNG